MEILLVIAMLIGILQSFQSIRETRLGFREGVKPSNSLIEFTFLNR